MAKPTSEHPDATDDDRPVVIEGRGAAIADAGDDEWVDDGWAGDDWVDDDEDDFVYVPEDRGVVRKITAVAVCFVLFVGLVVGFSGYLLYSQVNPPGDNKDAVLLVIPKDAGLATISRLLEEKEIIGNATIFRYYAKYKDIPPIRAGQYDRLTKHEAMDEVINRLKEGPLPPKFSSITIPEGLWVVDTLARIKADPTLEMTDTELALAAKAAQSKYQPKGGDPVGFLYPATYRVEDADKDNEAKLIQQMTSQFDLVGDEIGLGDPAAKLNGSQGKVVVGPYEIVIIASLIEAEAKVDEDRARIARVIYNRLKVNEPLGIDAALFVAIGQHKTEITKDDLAIDSPYNLRRRPGLPPMPINSPGKASLIAALNPTTEPGSDKWTYYVLADKEGHHFFTGDQREFDRAVQRARDAGLL